MSYCVVRCWCCTTPCTTLYDASYIPDASGPDALYDAPTRRTMHFRQHSMCALSVANKMGTAHCKPWRCLETIGGLFGIQRKARHPHHRNWTQSLS